MATSNVESDQAWGALANVAEAEREEKMDQRYKELITLSEEERASQMAAMVKAEYALADAELRGFTLSRLRTWLKLDEDVARGVAATYDAVMLKMPGPWAMRRVALVQTLAREFPGEQQAQLVELLPDVFGGLKEAMLAQSLIKALADTPAAAATPAKKGWWPFNRG